MSQEQPSEGQQQKQMKHPLPLGKMALFLSVAFGPLGVIAIFITGRLTQSSFLLLIVTGLFIVLILTLFLLGLSSIDKPER